MREHRKRPHPDNTRPQDQARIAQPGGRLTLDKHAAPVEELVERHQDPEQSRGIQELIQVAGGGLKKEGAPDQHHYQPGNDHRHYKHRAVEKLQLDAAAPVDAHGHQQGGTHLDHIPATQDERHLE